MLSSEEIKVLRRPTGLMRVLHTL